MHEYPSVPLVFIFNLESIHVYRCPPLNSFKFSTVCNIRVNLVLQLYNIVKSLC
jgi:hypothetical protein